MFDDFIIKNYEDKYYEDLSSSYLKAFKKNFLSREDYSNRFKNGNIYSSYLLIKKENQSIIGHIGFKLNNLNSKNKGKVAFRYSTFISSSYRGTGLYRYFMDQIKGLLIKDFKVEIIFAWPNINNLISCLRDSDYFNQFPIITWQHKLRKNNFSYVNLKQYKIDDFCEHKLKFKVINSERKLTLDSVEDLKKILFDRVNKKYKIIYTEKNYSIIGESTIADINYLSIVFIQGFNIYDLLSILNDIYKGDNYIVQIWCDPQNRDLQGSLLKSKFLPDGPIFYNGIYYLSEKIFKSENYFPSMYNHDAF